MGGQSINNQLYQSQDMQHTKVDLGFNRKTLQVTNYQKLNQKSYEVSLNREKATIPKWLQEKLKSQGKSQIEPRVFQPKQKTILETMKKHQTAPKPPKQPVKRVKRQDTVEKKFDLRNIFVLLDDQNILAEDL